ncbi:MAG: V-type ATP synthase subunit D [Anaeromyxobacteraceae bacterium]|nr:V-type ATP synthase subunit D [Anaeromyxobacteraceae bacterium]
MARAPTTRMGLLEVRARRAVAEKGARLLRAKREVLTGELLRLVREVRLGRSRLDRELREAARALELARALGGEPWLESLAWTAAREIRVEVTARRVWGVPTAAVTAPPLLRAADERGAAATSFGPAAAGAARAHEAALATLLGIATRELHATRLGEEIRATSRRIDTLEQLVLPELLGEARRVAAALEEREREDAVRLRRFRRRRGVAGGAPGA